MSINLKIILEVYHEDAKTMLPHTVRLSIRSTHQVTIGQIRQTIEGDEIGYSTPEHNLRAEKCPICGYPLTITKTPEVSSLGKCHQRCLRCCVCYKPISDKFQVRNKKIYCPSCC